ncbi:MAG: patatin-like phospholipase family protein [Actinomycetota bacterium]
MALTAAQERALRELDEIAMHGDVLRVISTHEVTSAVMVTIEVSTAGVRRYPGGIDLGERERFDIYIWDTHPFDHPNVAVKHLRWVDHAHVNWGHWLCLYLSPANQWDPSRGMFGFVERLARWLGDAGEGRLDPEGVPVHPPISRAVERSNTSLVVRADVPFETGGDVEHAQLLWANLEPLAQGGYAVTSWHRAAAERTPIVAAAMLTPQRALGEYPASLNALLGHLERVGVPGAFAVRFLAETATANPAGHPLLVIVGTRNRGTSANPMTHLVAFEVPVEMAERFRQLGDADDPTVDELIAWSIDATMSYIQVYEARPTIVHRRDADSWASAFMGKSVLVLGCGAIGGWIAECAARAAAARLTVVDSKRVTPGVEVRQPYVFDDEIRPKASALAARLDSIRPGAVAIDAHHGDASAYLRDIAPLDEFDIIIDATTSHAVAACLESVLGDRSGVAVATVAIDATASKGMLLFSGAGSPGGTYALDTRAQGALRGHRFGSPYLTAFWTGEDDSGLIQPEPGCSEPTFRGSAADTLALAGALTNAIGASLRDGTASSATFIDTDYTRPSTTGVPCIRFNWEPDVVATISDGRARVRIAANAAQTMAQLMQTTAPSETGGLLFGVDDRAVGAIYVELASRPPPDSTGTPTGFVRGTDGTAQLIDDVAMRSAGALAYLGDWHSHPGSEPEPSNIDRRAVRDLEHQGSPLFVIIGGDPDEPQYAGYVLDPQRAPTRVPDRAETPSQRLVVSVPEIPGRGESRPSRLDPCDAPMPPRSALDPIGPGRRPIAVALSGGGLRTTLVALGALRFLADAEVLRDVRIVSSVSGGSIANAVVARVWDDLRSSAHTTNDFDDLALRPVLDVVTRRSITRALIRGAWRAISPSSSRTDVLARVLDRTWFHGVHLEALPTGAWFEFNAANLQTGARFRFDRDVFGDYVIGSVATTGSSVRLATAVAASAAVPGLFAPMDLDAPFPCAGRQLGATLVDGGCYDNLALEAIRVRDEIPNPIVVAVNAGSTLEQGRLGRSPLVGPLLRAQALLYRQSTALRARTLMRDFMSEAGLQGVTFTLGTRFRPETLQEDARERYAEWCNENPEQSQTTRDALERFPTTFSTIPTPTADALIYRGWWLCGATLLTYQPDAIGGVLPSWRSTLP